MRLIILTIIVCVAIVSLSSCEKIESPLSDSLPTFRNTVFTAKATNGGSFVCPIEGNKTNEIPPRYLAKNEFGDLGIEIGYQYIGKGLVKETSRIDVYLISLKIGDKPVEYEPIIYEGGQKVVIDRPEIKVSFHQEKSSQ